MAGKQAVLCLLKYCGTERLLIWVGLTTLHFLVLLKPVNLFEAFPVKSTLREFPMRSIPVYHSAIILSVVFAIAPSSMQAESPTDWLGWRGPNGNGIAVTGQQPPVAWSAEKNVLWKTPVPGRGHSSPVLVGDQIILTTADDSKQVQSVVCFDRKTGRQLWKTDVNTGGFPKKIHRKNTHATPTVACNGKTLFAVFNNHGSIQLTALSLDGKQLWQKVAGDYRPGKYQFGYAPSPTPYKSLVILAAECDTDSYLIAFDQKTGDKVWRTERPNEVSYSSPIVAKLAGKDQLLVSGCGLVAAFNPSNGKEIWSCEGISMATCGTVVWDGDFVFVSGGYPKNGTLAVKADGSAKTAWSNPVKCYEQSMLASKGYLYAVSDGGIAYCWNAKTGKQMWQQRLGGGSVSASPILANGNIYATNERGTTFVFKANPKKYGSVSRNQLGNQTFASTVISDSKIYIRTTLNTNAGSQEMLYCLGKEK
jgi:outer membrane protein assembly factor BamB